MLTLRNCTLGIEFGSTRIKAVLVDDACKPAAQGDFTWENRLENGVWTYRAGRRVGVVCRPPTPALAADVQAKYGAAADPRWAASAFLAMMHGYLPFDAGGQSAGRLPHLAQHDDRPGGGGADRRRSASTFPSGGA